MAKRDLATRMRHQLRIDAQNRIDNGRGGRTVVPGEDPWRIVADRVWAEIIGLRGDEATQNAVLRARQLWRVTIRARHGMVTGMRLVWRDRMLGELIGNIKAIAPDDTGDALVMTVETGAVG